MNDCLNMGPTNVKLFDVLIKFREGNFSVLSDISKAFYWLKIHKSDQKFVEFLWTDVEREMLPSFVSNISDIWGNL